MTRSSTVARRRARSKMPASPAATDSETSTKTASAADTEPSTVEAPKPAKALPGETTKLGRIIAALSREEGASVAQLAELTGWKINSVRGVLAGALKTKHGLTITSTKSDGVRTYRVMGSAEG